MYFDQIHHPFPSPFEFLPCLSIIFSSQLQIILNKDQSPLIVACIARV